MRKKVYIPRDNSDNIKGGTKVTPTVAEMFAKLKKWNPSTLEQVIEVSNRLINAASVDIFYAIQNECDTKHRQWFAGLVGKIIYWDSGIKGQHEYLYVKEVKTEKKPKHLVYINGIRLSKYNRIGGNCLANYTLTIDTCEIIDTTKTSCTIRTFGFKHEYTICSNVQYVDTVGEMRKIAADVMKLPYEPSEPQKPKPRPKLKLSIKRGPTKRKD